MFDDLRSLVKKIDEMGKLKKVEGADWDLEIGTILELNTERNGPTLLFDKIRGYPEGYRIITYPLYSREAQILTFGFPEGLSDLEMVRYWQEKSSKFVPQKMSEIRSGPVEENVISGDAIDILKFPVPKWHEFDGGRYIGTGVCTITQDPDTGIINSGVYRVMVHDSKTLAFYVSPGKHATIMREKYWNKGKDCPVVMSFGQDPLLFVMSGAPLPWGLSEIDMVSYLKGKPFEVIKGKSTGLPIPATAEIVIEGFSPPPSVDSRPEGPFGEWTGYYASGSRNEPLVNIKTIYHRNDPILWGNPPLKPPISTAGFPIPVMTSASVWEALERCRIPGIKGVWIHGPANRVIIVVSIQQMYLGHAKQVATMAATLFSGGACTGRYAIVVDDDIDPTNWEEVTWAVCTRCDPATGIDIVTGLLTSPLDPMLSPEKREMKNYTTDKVVINACRPYHWIKDFPRVNRASNDLRKKVFDKWKHLFE
ncbi:MAG: UbiD family decarboxylase [Deltaproteobacteria bacterium]|nr:UbiD family decarboxylase [Deltaproteobacteria bacterium]